jgi:hypothetical protein
VNLHLTHLRIVVRPSEETNDHEVCLLGDGEDLIDRFESGLIGLDPDDILIPPSPLIATSVPHLATVARCDCGVIGCGSLEVTISREGEAVVWRSTHSPMLVQFDADLYDRELERAVNDRSWETADRKTARLIRESVDRCAPSERDLRFEWASGRLREGAMSLSLGYELGPHQLIVHVPVRNATPDALAERCLLLLAQDASTWTDVTWYPQQPGLSAPAIAGSGWRKGTA